MKEPFSRVVTNMVIVGLGTSGLGFLGHGLYAFFRTDKQPFLVIALAGLVLFLICLQARRRLDGKK